MSFNLADILYIEDTGEYVMLVGRETGKDKGQDHYANDYVWNMVDILSGSKYWEWESVLEDSGMYEVIA